MKKKNNWQDFNNLLGLNEHHTRISVIFIVMILALIVFWIIISDVVMIKSLYWIPFNRYLQITIDLIFIFILVVLSYILVNRLISNHRKLLEINSFLSSIMDSSNEIMMFSLDHTYRYTYFNQRHQLVMQEHWGKQIAAGMNILSVIDVEEDRIKAKKAFDQAFQGQSMKLIEDYGNIKLKRSHWQNYYAPIYDQNRTIIGCSCFSINVSKLVDEEQKSRQLSYRDTLTELYNRRYFQEACTSLGATENLPVSVIIADVNGLKFTNDVFGHQEGDRLIIQFARILEHVLPKNSIIARIGGDEFGILLPKTNEKEGLELIRQIEENVIRNHQEKLTLSVSLGIATKWQNDESLEQIVAHADSLMYHNKMINRLDFEEKLINSLSNYFYQKPAERLHAENTSHYAKAIGMAMKLREDDLNILELVGYLHDIGKITLNFQLLNRNTAHPSKKAVTQHCEAGYKILHFFERYRDFAGYVLMHHEQPDGKGLPNGLYGDDIPILARIVAVANVYDAMVNTLPPKKAKTEAEAIEELLLLKQTQLDGHIVDIFINKILINY
ncbi:MAG: diguanylate cyclase [Erysipelotrichaceae bacterium]|nr:diguanylate cyclase [Erysipelotrichaceae bacterium]